MTLGPTLILLAWSPRNPGLISRCLVTFGRVPLFFYLVHLYLIHGLVLIIAKTQSRDVTAYLTSFSHFPPDWGFSLPVVYGLWLGVLLLLYPPCRAFARLRPDHGRCGRGISEFHGGPGSRGSNSVRPMQVFAERSRCGRFGISLQELFRWIASNGPAYLIPRCFANGTDCCGRARRRLPTSFERSNPKRRVSPAAEDPPRLQRSRPAPLDRPRALAWADASDCEVFDLGITELPGSRRNAAEDHMLELAYVSGQR